MTNIRQTKGLRRVAEASRRARSESGLTDAVLLFVNGGNTYDRVVDMTLRLLDGPAERDVILEINKLINEGRVQVHYGEHGCRAGDEWLIRKHRARKN